MSIPTGRRNQRRQSFDQFVRRQEQPDTAAGAGLDAFVNQTLRINLAQRFEREDRTGAVP